MYPASHRTLQTVDPGWKRHNGSTLSSGAGLNWKTVDLTGATTSCGRYRDLSVYKPRHARRKARHHHLRKPTAPCWSPARGLKPHKLHIWLCILLYLLTLCQASVNKVKHSLRFVHILQMNSNSALQDHRYCSIDIKCIQAAQWTERQPDKRCFCHQAALPFSRQSQCSSLCYLKRLYKGGRKHFTGILIYKTVIIKIKPRTRDNKTTSKNRC